MTQHPTPDHFRRVLSTFATGITVITSHDSAGAPIGFTCQSFASISLDPPLIMISVMHTSRTLPALLAHGSFTVNVLPEGTDELARRFAGDPAQRWAHTRIDDTANSRHPVLSTHLAWLDCDVHRVVPAGDHTIVLATVRTLGEQPGEPLVWVRGGFRELASA